jgi:hypothetical protein
MKMGKLWDDDTKRKVSQSVIAGIISKAVAGVIVILAIWFFGFFKAPSEGGSDEAVEISSVKSDPNNFRKGSYSDGLGLGKAKGDSAHKDGDSIYIQERITRVKSYEDSNHQIILDNATIVFDSADTRNIHLLDHPILSFSANWWVKLIAWLLIVVPILCVSLSPFFSSEYIGYIFMLSQIGIRIHGWVNFVIFLIFLLLSLILTTFYLFVWCRLSQWIPLHYALYKMESMWNTIFDLL